jgi:hypothetical protein
LALPIDDSDNPLMAEESSELSIRIRRLLAQLGDAIGESVSSSAEVNEMIRRIREEGQHIYVVLDARIGIDPDRQKAYDAAKNGRGPKRGVNLAGKGGTKATPAVERTERMLTGIEGPTGEFRMNIGDALFLRSLGIDGTLRIRRARRKSPLVPDDFDGR